MIAAALMLACLAGCGREEKPVVVVYTALDEMFSRQPTRKVSVRFGFRRNSLFSGFKAL